MNGKALVGFGVALVIVAIAACSSSTTGTSSGTSGTSGTSGGAGTFTCCLNSKNYSCPDKAAFDKCSGFDISACTAACTGSDPKCFNDCTMKGAASTHDPSSCTSTTMTCGGSSSGTSGSDCAVTATPCSITSDCCTGLTCSPRQDGMSSGSCQ